MSPPGKWHQTNHGESYPYPVERQRLTSLTELASASSGSHFFKKIKRFKKTKRCFKKMFCKNYHDDDPLTIFPSHNKKKQKKNILKK